MPHFYRYLHDPSWVVESKDPRPDLLEYAYWTEIEAPVKPKPTPAPKLEPVEPVEPAGDTDATPEPEPEAEPKPVAKPPRRNAKAA